LSFNCIEDGVFGAEQKKKSFVAAKKNLDMSSAEVLFLSILLQYFFQVKSYLHEQNS
jgi:hypothetical protein